jgi:Zn-finger nucleic acid-binding protein
MGNHNGFYILFVTFSLLATLGSSLGRFGFDTSLQVLRGATYSDFQCLRHHNYTFAVLQAFDGDNGYNWDIDKCTNWAWNAGFYNVDVYIFMCPNCRGNNPPESAIQQIINNLRSQNVKFGLLWLDVEYCDGCWNDRSSNAKFLSKAVSQVISMGNKVGIYSSKNDWENVLGNFLLFLRENKYKTLNLSKNGHFSTQKEIIPLSAPFPCGMRIGTEYQTSTTDSIALEDGRGQQ